ncbi:F0F1 ATP synthase subunit epsilon [Bradyrhizobium sp.]|uniref:F0F1 ATP synthase subunit epsilon n=1 Tax=Bradyrhizobium sp. TaxID=376 RepID=UPI003C72FA7A
MSTFQLSLVSPEKLLFAGQVDQVDLPGAEGDFGVLAGHAPVVAVLRPGIVTTITGAVRDRFVVFGGLAEFSDAELTILADSATSAEDVDLAELKTKIEEMQEGLTKTLPGAEFDSAVARLDHYKSMHITLAPATAF